MKPLLEIRNLSKHFENITAVANLDLTLRQGEIRGVIGPNGSGKSSLFNLISGVYVPDPGSRIIFDGRDITGWAAHRIAKRGLSRTFQLLRLFSEMTVLENLLIGCHCRVQKSFFPMMFGTLGTRYEERRLREEMRDLLSFIGLDRYSDMLAGEMSIGQRRLLALGRAIAMQPKLLLLDEPAAGLSPTNVDNLISTVFALKKRYDLTVVIIEHILKVVMEGCDTVTVLDHGEKIAEGTPAEVRADHRVVEAYLGKEMPDAEIRALFRAA